MSLRKVLIQSRKLPAQNVEDLWEHIYKNNVKLTTLCSILAFYMHHRVYPPPVQKAFDVLMIASTDPKMSKKLKTVLFQTIEEMCHWLSPSCISDAVKFSSCPSVIAELLPCFLIYKDIAFPDVKVYERLISALTSPGLTRDERCKILGFLMATVPVDLQPMLNKHLIVWLSYSRTPQTSGSLFKSTDVTEVDGSTSVGTCTALTLVKMVTDVHILSLTVFSNLRKYLSRSQGGADSNLIQSALSYCSTLVAQAAKKPNSQHDKQLISVILEEVVLLMRTIRDVDSSCKGRCQLMVQNVQLLVEQQKLSSLLVTVWDYQLSQGADSPLTEKILGSVIKAEFSNGHVSQRLAGVIMAHGSRLAPSLAQFIPNLMKLIATHPSALVEEFLEIVVHLTHNKGLATEVVHSILDLPLLSASICVHQTALLAQAGIRVPVLISAKQKLEADPKHKSVYSHIMRSQTHAGQIDFLLKRYPGYLAALMPVFSFGLVEVCSQVTPLLLETFLDSVSDCPDTNRVMLPTLLTKAPLLCPLPSYQKAVFDIISQYVTKVGKIQPELLENSCVIQFLSVNNHYHLCPQLFESLVSAVGDLIQTEQMVVSIFETLDALLREIEVDKTCRDIKLKASICTTLAKLASRHSSLIPRAIGALEKMSRTVESADEEEKEVLSQQTKELIRLLKNPRVASVVLSPSSKEDVAVAAILRVLFQFLD